MDFLYRYVFGIGLIIYSIVSFVLILKNKRLFKIRLLPGDSDELLKIRIIIGSICFFIIGLAIVFDFF